MTRLARVRAALATIAMWVAIGLSMILGGCAIVAAAWGIYLGATAAYADHRALWDVVTFLNQRLAAQQQPPRPADPTTTMPPAPPKGR